MNQILDSQQAFHIWGVYCEDFGENWQCFNYTTLCIIITGACTELVPHCKTCSRRQRGFCIECEDEYIMRSNGRLAICESKTPLQWRYIGRDGVSNQQGRHCLLNRLFRRRSKTTSKLRVTGLCAGNIPVISEFPAQMASNAKTFFPFNDVIMI